MGGLSRFCCQKIGIWGCSHWISQLCQVGAASSFAAGLRSDLEPPPLCQALQPNEAFLSHKIRQTPNFKDICAAQALIPMGLGLDWEFAFGPLCLDRNSLFQLGVGAGGPAAPRAGPCATGCDTRPSCPSLIIPDYP